ncbi:MAG: hypothetical protein V2A62_04330 [Candidatus Woesearchaeota archaeon]
MAKVLEYDIVSGNLGAVRQLEAQGYRLQTGRELQDDRCKDGQEDLQSRFFYVANANGFYPHPQQKGTFCWAYTDGVHNLITQPQYLDRALRELPPTGIFRPDAAQESWEAIRDRSSKRFSLSDLGLVRENDEWSFILVETGKYDNLNPMQKRAAAMVGHTRKNVAYMAQKGITESRIWLPNPKYLAGVFEEKGEDPIWRASWLLNFNYYSCFNAYFHLISNANSLRGVRSVVVPVGDASKNADALAECDRGIVIPYDAAFQRVIDSSQELNDVRAAELSNLLTLYLRSRK